MTSNDSACIDEVFSTVVDVTVPTSVEVATVLSRTFGLGEEARSISDDLSRTGIRIVPFDLAETAHIAEVLRGGGHAEDRARCGPHGRTTLARRPHRRGHR